MYTVKWFQVKCNSNNTNLGTQPKSFKFCYLFNTNYSIQHYLFVCTQLNGSKYCYVSLIIQLDMLYIDFQPGQAVKIGNAPV